MKKVLINLLIIFILFTNNIEGDEYININNDCTSTCYVYCEVAADFSVNIPTNGIGEYEVNGNMEVEVTTIDNIPTIYKIETL